MDPFFSIWRIVDLRKESFHFFFYSYFKSGERKNWILIVYENNNKENVNIIIRIKIKRVLIIIDKKKIFYMSSRDNKYQIKKKNFHASAKFSLL